MSSFLKKPTPPSSHPHIEDTTNPVLIGTGTSSFTPSLTVNDVNLNSLLGSTHKLVICNSLNNTNTNTNSNASKEVSTNSIYNVREVECKIASVVLGKLHLADIIDSRADDSWKTLENLRECMRFCTSDNSTTDTENKSEVNDKQHLTNMTEITETLLSLCTSADPEKPANSEFYIDDIMRLLSLGRLKAGEEGVNPGGIHSLISILDDFKNDPEHLDSNGHVFPVESKGGGDLTEYTFDDAVRFLVDSFFSSTSPIVGKGEAERVLRSNKRLFILERALHVYSEALRVVEITSLLTAQSSTGTGSKGTPNFKALATLAKRINHSQESLKTLYDFSSPSIDLLVEISSKVGANASKLIGNDGLTISLVSVSKLEGFIQCVSEGYYEGVLGLTDVPTGSIVVCNGSEGEARLLSLESLKV